MIELGIWLLLASVVSRAATPERAVRVACRVSQEVWASRSRAREKEMDIERAAHSWGRWMRWLDCMDRAIAVKWWMAARGEPAVLVVGFRKSETWEGHAWLERGGRRWFVEPGAGYREVFREGAS